jgi:hypothetical protein
MCLDIVTRYFVQKSFITTFAFAGALFLSSFSAAEAVTINIVRSDLEGIESVHGMHENTATYGYDIAGAQVTATFDDGTVENITWVSDPRIWTEPDGTTYGSPLGFAYGENLNISLGTYGFEMTTTSLLTSLSFDMAPANAVFDTTFAFDSSGSSTVGSGYGEAFYLYAGYEDLEGTINASYSGIVNLADDAPVGDLFTTMTVDFSMLALGGILGNLDFISDLDRMHADGDLLPAVPLSASMSFLLLGLGSLGASRFAKKRRTQVSATA